MLVGLDDDTRHHETRVLENGPAVAYSARGLYRTTYISPNVSRFLGYPAEMFLADPDFWADLIHPDDRDRVAAGLARLPEVGHIHHEYRMRHKSGAWRWVRDQVNLVRGDGNTANIDHLAGFWIDVTADILALEESEDRLSDYAESAADWFWETDEHFRFVEASSGSDIGVPFNESYRGKTRAEIADEETDNQKWRDHQAALENHQPFRDFVYTRIDSAGRRRHIRVSGRPVFDDNGVFRGHRGAGSDVTRQAEAEQTVIKSEARFRTLIENSNQGILAVCRTLGWISLRIAG